MLGTSICIFNNDRYVDTFLREDLRTRVQRKVLNKSNNNKYCGDESEKLGVSKELLRSYGVSGGHLNENRVYTVAERVSFMDIRPRRYVRLKFPAEYS